MIVVLGLGPMGGAIAGRLVDCGYQVTGVDPDEGARTTWVERTGAPSSRDLGELAWQDVSRVFVVVRTTGQTRMVLESLLELVPAGSGLPCHLITTLDLEFADRLADVAGEEGRLRLLEQPVSGGVGAARQGTLTMATAGPLNGDDESVLADVTSNLVELERYGQPSRAKLLNNAAGAYNAAAMARILDLAVAMGIDPGAVHGLVMVSSGASWMAGAIPDLRDDLLAKDVALLRAAVGRLPVVEVEAHLEEDLARARRLIAGGDQPEIS